MSYQEVKLYVGFLYTGFINILSFVVNNILLFALNIPPKIVLNENIHKGYELMI